MTRLWILSDLHVDVCEWSPPKPRPAHDVAVVAGDVRSDLAKRGLLWLARELGTAVPLVYVPGNHDYYRTRLDTEKAKARELAGAAGIHLLLDGEAVELAGVRFVGATLWTDFALHPDYEWQAQREASHRMTDYRAIRTGEAYRRLTPRDTAAEHARHRAAIEAALATPFSGPTVVVTHHAPHPRSLRGGRWAEPLDAAYASDLSAIMQGPGAPDLWIHGHVHRRQDYRVGGTRVVANPRGYVTTRRMGGREVAEVENPAFDPGYTLDL